MPPAPTAVDAARLRLAVMRLSRRLRQEAGGGITPSQLSALATLDRVGPMALRDLAAAEGVGASTLTRIVAALEEQRFIERTTDPADRRVALVRVAPRGRQLLRTARDRGTRLVAERLGRLDDDEIATLAAAVPLLEALLEGDA